MGCGLGQRLCNEWASLRALGGHQGGSWLLGLDQASNRKPIHFPGSSCHPAVPILMKATWPHLTGNCWPPTSSMELL